MREAAAGTVPATEFKARCLELMDRVAEGRDTYVITKRGKPVAKLVPADPPPPDSVFGCMIDQTNFLGELDTPLQTEAGWKALERERAAQWKSWEREEASPGTRSRKLAGGRLPRVTQSKSGARAKVSRPRR
jgi:prevent-host-death family protein